MQRPWPLAKATGFILVWESLTGIISARLPRSCGVWVRGTVLEEGDWLVLCVVTITNVNVALSTSGVLVEQHAPCSVFYSNRNAVEFVLHVLCYAPSV
jgi:hypothetical protein